MEKTSDFTGSHLMSHLFSSATYRAVDLHADAEDVYVSLALCCSVPEVTAGMKHAYKQLTQGVDIRASGGQRLEEVDGL
jgi:hypothetical protein